MNSELEQMSIRIRYWTENSYRPKTVLRIKKVRRSKETNGVFKFKGGPPALYGRTMKGL
jgi:hypothetical protein